MNKKVIAKVIFKKNSDGTQQTQIEGDAWDIFHLVGFALYEMKENNRDMYQMLLSAFNSVEGFEEKMRKQAETN